MKFGDEWSGIIQPSLFHYQQMGPKERVTFFFFFYFILFLLQVYRNDRFAIFGFLVFFIYFEFFNFGKFDVCVGTHLLDNFALRLHKSVF